MKIVIPDRIDIPQKAKQELEHLGATIYDDTPTDDATILERIRDAEIITGNYIDVTKSIIDGAPKLKYIIAPAVGYEWIDYRYAASKGIKVVNCPTFNSIAVAEHAIALLFAVKRKIADAAASMRSGRWQHEAYKGTETHGKKLGLIGYGKIGKQVAEMAQGLGMHVTHANTASTPPDIDQLVGESDVVCLCLPLNDSTRNILDERRLALMQPHAILINVGRGATVDQKALIKTLQEKRIAGAGLDVFDNEPLTGEPPQEIVTLAYLSNVTATPHMAYNTEETAERLGTELMANIKACLSNQPTNVVN